MLVCAYEKAGKEITNNSMSMKLSNKRTFYNFVSFFNVTFFDFFFKKTPAESTWNVFCRNHT